MRRSVLDLEKGMCIGDMHEVRRGDVDKLWIKEPHLITQYVCIPHYDAGELVRQVIPHAGNKFLYVVNITGDESTVMRVDAVWCYDRAYFGTCTIEVKMGHGGYKMKVNGAAGEDLTKAACVRWFEEAIERGDATIAVLNPRVEVRLERW